jgi:hypothetical protein
MQAQQLHDDQIALAGVKDKQKTSDSAKGSVPPAKPKQSEKVSGESSVRNPVS